MLSYPQVVECYNICNSDSFENCPSVHDQCLWR